MDRDTTSQAEKDIGKPIHKPLLAVRVLRVGLGLLRHKLLLDVFDEFLEHRIRFSANNGLPELADLAHDANVGIH